MRGDKQWVCFLFLLCIITVLTLTEDEHIFNHTVLSLRGLDPSLASIEDIDGRREVWAM